MSEKYRGITIEIKLTGPNAEAFLAKNGKFGKTFRDENGHYLVGKFSGRKRRSVLGTTDIVFGLVKETENREVILIGGILGNKGKGRRVSVSNEEGIGTQQLRKGIDLIVQTDAPVALFENNIR